MNKYFIIFFKNEQPGSLIEWRNNWMNAIVHRQRMNEDVAGFFTQIGELYVVHHLWGKE